MTRILVVDDHAVVRQGVKQILSEQFHGAVLGDAQNAEEMIAMLTRQYNRARQAYVTKELMEIVSGAEALK